MKFTFSDVLLKTRRAILLYKVYGDSALLVLNGTSLNSVNALLVLSWQYGMKFTYLLYFAGRFPLLSPSVIFPCLIYSLHTVYQALYLGNIFFFGGGFVLSSSRIINTQGNTCVCVVITYIYPTCWVSMNNIFFFFAKWRLSSSFFCFVFFSSGGA